MTIPYEGVPFWSAPDGWRPTVCKHLQGIPFPCQGCSAGQKTDRLEWVTAELLAARAEIIRLAEATVSLLQHQTALEHELRQVAEERDLAIAAVESARRLASWLYRNGGREMLDAAGGSDVSEWPWLQGEQERS